jgi:hypothetical protein
MFVGMRGLFRGLDGLYEGVSAGFSLYQLCKCIVLCDIDR